MSFPGPEFGDRTAGLSYTERPGAYGIIRAPKGQLAFVRGRSGRLHLPGGGIDPGETPRAALLREIAEEIGRKAQVLTVLGHATQFLSTVDEGRFAIRATYFRVELIGYEHSGMEHDLLWLTAEAAFPELARECDAWALSVVR